MATKTLGAKQRPADRRRFTSAARARDEAAGNKLSTSFHKYDHVVGFMERGTKDDGKIVLACGWW